MASAGDDPAVPGKLKVVSSFKEGLSNNLDLALLNGVVPFSWTRFDMAYDATDISNSIHVSYQYVCRL